MKVLLINPPSDSPQPVMPLGLAYLAAALECDNVLVEVIDAWAERLDFDSLEKRIAQAKDVGLIGITVMSPVYPTGIKTVQVARRASPYAKIIIGGTHPSSLPEQCLQECPELDFVAVGEGENLIVQLVRALQGKSIPLNEIKGLWYRNNNKVITNHRAEPVQNLDELPFPARHLFPLEKYKVHPPYRLYKSFATMITSRGCPFQCAYCTKSVSGQNFRYQSTERVIREIEFLIDKYNIKQIHFYDDDFTINKSRVEELCEELILRRIKITWSCVTRVDLVNERLLKKMKDSGCFLISYGVESGSQKILDNIRRGYHVGQIKEAFRLTKKAGIRTLGYFMAGLPGETYETLNETVKFSFELDPDFVSWSVTVLYPGSKLYEQALKGELGNNYVSTQMRAEDLITSSRSPFAHGHAYFYRGEVPKEYILDTIDKSYKNFYFRVGYIARFLTKLQTFTEALCYLNTFIQYLGWQKKS
ncbi:MAG: radical SAM protein [Candidatus Brocadiaceae bacterium]|nr:radical SAM protein [Candidatus Brocadiaceae bacterium]